MAEASKTASEVNKVPNQGDHDRVQMLSLKADGTPDQHNPEIIGDKDVAKAAAREQFKQQAVSAADVPETTEPVMLVGQKDGSVKEVKASEAPQDPSIESRQSEHEKVAKAAESAADKAVDSLSKD